MNVCFSCICSEVLGLCFTNKKGDYKLSTNDWRYYTHKIHNKNDIKSVANCAFDNKCYKNLLNSLNICKKLTSNRVYVNDWPVIAVDDVTLKSVSCDILVLAGIQDGKVTTVAARQFTHRNEHRLLLGPRLCDLARVCKTNDITVSNGGYILCRFISQQDDR